MDLTEEQRRALEHARAILHVERGRGQPLPDSEWRVLLRYALADLVEALTEQEGQP